MNSNLSGLIFFLSIFTLEYVFPFFRYDRPRYKHAIPNLIIAATNTVFIFGFLNVMQQILGLTGNFPGFLNTISIPITARTALAVFILDLWMYWWHRINHEIHFFWRFHRMHHTDPAMDSTTALRFHPIEIMFAYTLNTAILLVAGLNIKDLLLYQTLLFPIILFHHSNIALPKKWDSLLTSVFVMPNMHRVHHSEKPEETNSNYGSIFSFWDRLFQSFKKRDDIKSIVYGIGIFKSPKWQNLRGMIFVPFARK